MKKITLITLTFLLMLIFSGCVGKMHDDRTFDELAYGEKGPIKLSSEQHEQVGDGYVRRNSPEMALMHYNKSIELDSSNLNARVKRGDLLISQGLDEQALAEFNNVLEQDANHAIANESAGGVYFRAGLYAEAEIHLRKAVRLNPILWKAHNYLGILQDRESKYDLAAKSFADALSLHHGNGADEIYNNLGVVHIAREQYGMAVSAFRNALKNGGISARTYNNLGLALTRLNRLDEALESFKYAGGESKANNNIGYVLMTDGQPDKAIPYFEKAIELSHNYYVKAADNLKRARMAARFQKIGTQHTGSTPNPLLRQSFPDSEQNHDGSAAAPASADPSSPVSDIQKISLPESGSGVIILEKSYGLHISSWRDHSWAFDHCSKLQKKGFDTWINQVDLGEKGIWYRVLVGKFSTVKEAVSERPNILKSLNVERAPVFRRVLPKVDGFHL
jgi:Flp pilus assembly protein TadD